MPTLAKSLNIRDRAILSHVWIITEEERQKLDRFFLLHDKGSNIANDIQFDEDDGCYTLVQENSVYRVVLMEPLATIKKAVDVGLSFRVCFRSNFYYVLVKTWKEGSSNNETNGG